MKLPRQILLLLVLLVIVGALAAVFLFVQPASPRPWTTTDVIKHLQAQGLSVENPNTDYAALPENLQRDQDMPCRERIVFSIREVPYNQLFVCDTIQQVGDLQLRYLQSIVKETNNPHVVMANSRALVVLVLNPTIDREVAFLYEKALITLGVKYVGPTGSE
jgi:hypothetical protein